MFARNGRAKKSPPARRYFGTYENIEAMSLATPPEQRRYAFTRPEYGGALKRH
jgi:hypothetical protein